MNVPSLETPILRIPPFVRYVIATTAAGTAIGAALSGHPELSLAFAAGLFTAAFILA